MGSLETTRRINVRIPASGTAGSRNEMVLHGTLTIPDAPRGCVIFAHGSASGRKSPRNLHVSARLEAAGFMTLLFDLLTIEEAHEDASTGRFRFDIGLLASRLVAATEWLSGSEPAARDTLIGYFGASTGAAAALVAACSLPGAISAVVSRGGRPDLAGPFLERVESPTLLIVGALDTNVISLNERAMTELRRAEHELVTVPGAGHLFEEEGALERVCDLTIEWFDRYLAMGRTPPKIRREPPSERPWTIE